MTRTARPGLVFLLLFLCLTAALPAWGSREEKNTAAQEEKGTLVRVSGRVRLVGSAPVTELVITGPDKEWYIAKEDEYKLRDLQQQIVTVEGIETVEKLTFASGLPAGERRTLKNIKLITNP